MDTLQMFFDLMGYFVFLYPVAMSVLWIAGGFNFWLQYERKETKQKQKWPAKWPPVTLLVPCHNEAAFIATTCKSLVSLDYPNYRVIFIDDASTDNTVEIIRQWTTEVGYFHLLRLEVNQGKAQALNWAIKTAVKTPLTIVIDADTLLKADTLKWLIAPFCHRPALGAVTGNPIAINRTNFLKNLQAAEFTSIIGLIKRAQSMYGRLFTVSGCLTAYRIEAIMQVGGFSPYTATEDIDVTWRLQRNLFEIGFVPQATAFIQVPEKLNDYWKQRSRWALGSWHMLRTHAGVFQSWSLRRLWLIYLESVMSLVWSFMFVFGTISWFVMEFIYQSPAGFAPLPVFYSGILSFFGLLQFFVSVAMNQRYDPGLRKTLFWVPWYPLFFFVFGPLTVIHTMGKGLFGSLEFAGKWSSPDREKVIMDS